MDSHRTLVLDISSDDEVGFEDSSIADNFDWVWSFLEDSPCGDDVNCNNGGVLDNGDDSDDVVVLDEVLPKPKKAKRSVPRCGDDDDDDDDCVVPDCDPNKRIEADVKGSVGDCDDLLIVGEKGQIACRDYPHSRHSCAKFPFSSTPHESHCNLCHCYVCDSLVPCAYWNSGDPSIAHWHATDKEVYWQLERKKVRQSKNTPVPITKQPVAAVARLHRPVPTAASSFGVPNIISQGRNARPGISVARSRYQPHLASQQLLRTCNSNTNTRSNRGSTLDTSLVSSRSICKRSRFTARPVGVNQSFHNSPNNVSVAYLHQLLNHQLVGKPIENGSITFRVFPSLENKCCCNK